jgi:putative flippase GtrA
MKKILNFLNAEFIRFIFTGFLNTVFGYGVYSLTYWIFNNKTIALILCYVIGVLFNFKSYSLIVFKSRDNSKIILFVLVYIFIYGLNYLSLRLFSDLIGFNAYISQLFALMYIPLILYLMMKQLVFKKN